MNALQTIINLADSLQIDRRKVVGVQYTRSEIARVSETPTRNPWRFGISVKAALPYSDCRDLLERIDEIDRKTPEYVTFSNNPKLDWVCRYRAQDVGSMTVALAQAMRVQGFEIVGGKKIPTRIVLSNLPAITGAGAITSTTPIFKAGDFVQFGSGTTNPYPYTVTNDVLRGTDNTVTITLNRPVFQAETAIINQSLSVGSNVTFRLFCPNMPVYTLIPGAPRLINGKLVNNAYIEWSDSFKLYEWTGDA